MPPALKLRRRLKGAAIGLAIGALVGLLLCLFFMTPDYLRERRNTPRLAAFNAQCGHPAMGNSATFDHATAGQSACEAFPSVVAIVHGHPYHDDPYWQYSLSIGTQTLEDKDGRDFSGNPETIGYVTEDLGWKNHRPIPVYALFWKGVLMSIYSRKYGYGRRAETLTNPSTARRRLASRSSGWALAYPICALALMGTFFGYGVTEKKIETEENGPSPSDKANAERLARPLPSDETELRTTGRNAVWLLQGLFFGFQAMTIGLGSASYSKASHPPKFAAPTPYVTPDPLVVGGAIAVGVLFLGGAAVATFRTIKPNPPFPPVHDIKLRAWNLVGLTLIAAFAFLLASMETLNPAFFVGGEAAIWAVTQLLIVPHYRAFWRAAIEEIRAQKSPLQRAT